LVRQDHGNSSAPKPKKNDSLKKSVESSGSGNFPMHDIAIVPAFRKSCNISFFIVTLALLFNPHNAARKRFLALK